ncbi:ABC transporter substrate-binding protein [Rhodoligotrophos ferricapiens]|uniref:ABC transporter substrate-binding protein n=1 Tax=Rhodoligotrophos ferricapiens TaxID=3069264 RepID=UPI00315DFEE6
MTTRSKRGEGLTRRDFAKTAGILGAGVVAAPYVLRGREAWAQETIVYVSYGGSTQEAEEDIIVAAFMKETGINVVNASGPDLAKIKAQVQTGNVEWDLVTLIGSQAVAAGREGLLEKLDYSIIDASDMYMPVLEFTAPWYAYGGGIAYDPQRHAAGKFPTNWPEFWDAERFPGRRGLRSRPDENLEMALMADGVPAKELYPLDVDRAFASLDRIKPHVAKWIPETPQTITLLQQNEIDFVFTYSGRVEAAQRQGVSVNFVYENNIVTPSYLCVPKGTKHLKAAMTLANYFLRPDLQAGFCNRMGYSPVKRAATDLLTPEVRAKQPNLDAPGTAVTDIEWWADNFVEVNQRFKEWMIS